MPSGPVYGRSWSVRGSARHSHDRRATAVSFKTVLSRPRTVGAMTPRLDAFGLVVSDLTASLAFYRRLGLDIPATAGGEGHVEVPLPGGMRLMIDTVETIRSFDPTWQPPTG